MQFSVRHQTSYMISFEICIAQSCQSRLLIHTNRPRAKRGIRSEKGLSFYYGASFASLLTSLDLLFNKSFIYSFIYTSIIDEAIFNRTSQLPTKIQRKNDEKSGRDFRKGHVEAVVPLYQQNLHPYMRTSEIIHYADFCCEASCASYDIDGNGMGPIDCRSYRFCDERCLQWDKKRCHIIFCTIFKIVGVTWIV